LPGVAGSSTFGFLVNSFRISLSLQRKSSGCHHALRKRLYVVGSILLEIGTTHEKSLPIRAAFSRPRPLRWPQAHRLRHIEVCWSTFALSILFDTHPLENCAIPGICGSCAYARMVFRRAGPEKRTRRALSVAAPAGARMGCATGGRCRVHERRRAATSPGCRRAACTPVALVRRGITEYGKPLVRPVRLEQV